MARNMKQAVVLAMVQPSLASKAVHRLNPTGRAFIPTQRLPQLRDDAALPPHPRRRTVRMADAPLSAAGVGVTIPQRDWGEAASRRELLETEALADSYDFQVTLRKPLGLELTEDGSGVAVLRCWRGGHAEAAGIKPGDRVVATCATLGGQMWEKKTVDGVVSAITSRLIVADDVTIRLRRSLEGHRSRSVPLDRTVTQSLEVSLARPVGLVLRQAADGVFVKELKAGSNAALSGLLREGDKVVGVSSSFGDSVHPTRSVEGVVSAVTTRFGGLVTLKVERTLSARELDAAAPVAEARAGSAEPSAFAAASATSNAAVVARAGAAVEAEAAAAALLPQAAAEARADRAVEMIRRFADVGSLDGVKRVLAASSEAPREAPAAKITLAAMSAAIRLGSAAAAVTMFDAAKAAGAQLNLSLFTTLLKAQGILGGQKGIAAAFQTVEDVKEAGLLPDVVLYNALLAACVRCGDLMRAQELFEAVMRPSSALARPLCDAVSWNTLINGHARERNADAAVSLLQEMRAAGIAPMRSTYTVTMKALASCGRMVEAMSLLSEMRLAAEGKEKMAPDTQTYNTIIQGHMRQLDWRAAVQITEDMEAEGNSGDALTLGLLMDGFNRAGLPHEALRRFKEARAAGISPNLQIYTCAVAAHAKRGEAFGALRLLDEMRRSGIRLSPLTFTAAMEACVAGGEPLLAESLYEEISRVCGPPDAVSVATLIKARFVAGNVAGARAAFDGLEEDGDAAAAAARGGSSGASEPKRRVAAGRGAPQAARRRRRAPIAAYNVMIEGFSAAGDYAAALDYMRRLRRSGYSASAGTSRAAAACTLGAHWMRSTPVEEVVAGPAASQADNERRMRFLGAVADALGPKMGRATAGTLYLALLKEHVDAGRVAEARQLVVDAAAGAFSTTDLRRKELEMLAALEERLRELDDSRQFAVRGLPGSLQERIAKSRAAAR